jgi:FlaA1/EpsC-like NDP-sugar epimerase
MVRGRDTVDMSNSRSIVVFGATGQIGSALINVTLARDSRPISC